MLENLFGTNDNYWICISSIGVHLERPNDKKDAKKNYTKEGASFEPFGSELHLVHRLEHCTKGQKNVGTPFWNK